MHFLNGSVVINNMSSLFPQGLRDISALKVWTSKSETPRGMFYFLGMIDTLVLGFRGGKGALFGLCESVCEVRWKLFPSLPLWADDDWSRNRASSGKEGDFSVHFLWRQAVGESLSAASQMYLNSVRWWMIKKPKVLRSYAPRTYIRDR